MFELINSFLNSIEISQPIMSDIELSSNDSVDDHPDYQSLDITYLQKELKRSNKKIKYLKKRKNRFRDELRTHKYKARLNSFSHLKYKELLESTFSEDQIKLLEFNRKNPNSNNSMKWSDCSIKMGLKLKFTCGSTGYEEIRKLFPLPCKRTLTGRIQNLKFESGVLHEVFDFLQIKVSKMTDFDKECVVIVDEMSIERGTQYDPSVKKIIGNVTFPSTTTRLAKNGLVVMLAGIATKWKQVVAYEFSGDFDNTDYGVKLKKLVFDVICAAENIGLSVSSFVSDMGPLNQKMWKEFGIVCKKNMNENRESLCEYIDLNTSVEHPVQKLINGSWPRKLYFFADVPHLFKNITQSLINNKIIILPDDVVVQYELPTNKINFEVVVNLFSLQTEFKSDLRLTPKLEEFKLHPNNFQKMKVKTSYHVLHPDVSAGLKVVAEETGEKELLTTAWFIDLVNKWFYLMTGRSESGGGWSLKCMEAYNESQYFLQEFISIFKVIQVGGNRAFKPIQQGAIISTTSMIEIHEYYLFTKKFSFFLPGRINQDTLENFFGTVRSKQSKPSALDFKNILKSISVCLYMKKTDNGSYDNDDRFYMKGFLELLKNQPKIVEPKLDLPPCPAWVYKQKILKYELMSLYNISGYLVKTIKNNNFKSCHVCLNELGSYTPSSLEYARFQLLKARHILSNSSSNSSKLFYVNESTFDFFQKMENVFRFYDEKDLLYTNNVKQELFNQMSKIDIRLSDCHGIKNRLINNFIVFRLRISAKRKIRTGINNYASNSMNEKSMN